ncbi:hypothetical protein AKJ16_DCAP25373 [Drosera capensis]
MEDETWWDTRARASSIMICLLSNLPSRKFSRRYEAFQGPSGALITYYNKRGKDKTNQGFHL